MRVQKTRRWVLTGAVCAVVAAAALGQAGRRLLVNGRAASNDVLVINGRAYVPLDDVAAALGLTVRQSATGFEVTSPSTPATSGSGTAPAVPSPAVAVPPTAPVAPPAPGTAASSQPQSASTDRWSFRTRKVAFPETYRETLHQPHREFRPLSAEDRLVVVTCRITNKLRSSQAPLLAMRTVGNTALVTADGRRFPPIAFDSRQESEAVANSAEGRLTPGAYQDFSLVFSIPRNEQLQELVFTIGNDPAEGQSTDVRVGLP